MVSCSFIKIRSEFNLFWSVSCKVGGDFKAWELNEPLIIIKRILFKNTLTQHFVLLCFWPFMASAYFGHLTWQRMLNMIFFPWRMDLNYFDSNTLLMFLVFLANWLGICIDPPAWCHDHGNPILMLKSFIWKKINIENFCNKNLVIKTCIKFLFKKKLYAACIFVFFNLSFCKVYTVIFRWSPRIKYKNHP